MSDDLTVDLTVDPSKFIAAVDRATVELRSHAVNIKSGPDEEVAVMVRNVADRVAALWREVHVHVDVDGCPDRSHQDLLAWLEQAEIDLQRFAHLTATRQER